MLLLLLVVVMGRPLADRLHVPPHHTRTQGTFAIELYYNHAPRTCHNIAGEFKKSELALHSSRYL